MGRGKWVLNVCALGWLVAAPLWLALSWSAIPARVVLRLGEAATGEKGGLVLFPVIGLFLYLLFTRAQRLGALNLPDLASPERNRAAARRVAPVLRLVLVAAVALALVACVALTVGSGWPLASFAAVLVACLALATWLLRR